MSRCSSESSVTRLRTREAGLLFLLALAVTLPFRTATNRSRGIITSLRLPQTSARLLLLRGCSYAALLLLLLLVVLLTGWLAVGDWLLDEGDVALVVVDSSVGTFE